MTKLTPSYLAILASACGRDDGLAVRPDTLKPAAAAKAAAKLIELEVVREVRAKGDMPVWRGDEQGRAYSLKILKAGRAAVQSAGPSTDVVATKIRSDASISLSPAGETEPKIAKPGSKRAVIIALLDRKDGVTIHDLMAATGWLPHTTRAALSGLRKSGLTIVRIRATGADTSVYRIQAGRGAELAA